MSDRAVPSDHLDARPSMLRGVGVYFGILLLLTLIAVTPGAITIGVLLFILPGLILIASGTLLYYSLAVLPAYFIARFFGKRLLAAAVAIICLAAAALLPHYIGVYRLRSLVAANHSDPPTSFQPRSFELPYPKGDNYWRNWQRPENRDITPPPPCADFCQQLLFKGNADQVFIRDHSSRGYSVLDGSMLITETWAKGRDGKMEREDRVFFKPRWRRFRLQQREPCPDTLSRVEFIGDVFRGRCLVEDTTYSADTDVVLSIVESDPRHRNPIQNVVLSGVETGPTTVTITERRDGRAIPVEVKTTLVAHYATVPFYFSTDRCGGGGEIPNLCLVVATDPFPSSFADPYEMIARRYGLPIAQTQPSKR